MKRRRDNILNQPAVKKPDVNASTDLRSKIGAKLQTLLLANRVQSFNRRQAFLLGEPQHSEIIIDPTIVVKKEAPEIEECNENTTVIDSPNFLLSAKSRITELLNKQGGGSNKYQNCEKENSHSSSKCIPVSSVNSATTSLDSLQAHNLQSLSCNSLSKKRKVSNNKNGPDSPSDVVSNQMHLQSMVVVVEDVMKDRTKLTHLLSNKPVLSETCSSNPESCLKNKSLPVGKQRKNKVAKDRAIIEVSNSLSCDNVEIYTIDDDNTTLPQSCVNSFNVKTSLNGKNSEFNASKSKSSENSTSVSLDQSFTYSEIDIGDILIAREKTTNYCANLNEDDSELIDDPGMHNRVVDNRQKSVSSENQTLENHDPDVVLLCVKQPTHEVITLEDGDDSDVVEDVHECGQCGKAFRAKSLLNFHIRMHGSDASSSSQSSSIS